MYFKEEIILAGHSKWANIQHRKGRQDAARGRMFTKIGKELTVAAKMGGGDINFNPRLRMAYDKAKNANMPKDNIERAIKKGTGELDGVDYVEIRYEGYGPEGVAVIVDVLTDNKNRSAASVRSIFSKNGGNLGETGAVGWMFNRKGVINVMKTVIDEEKLMEIALDNGAEDIKDEGENFVVHTEPTEYENVKKALEDAKIEIDFSEVTFVPENTVQITNEDTAKQVLKLYEKLEEDDDVQNVYANFEIDDDLMEKLI